MHLFPRIYLQFNLIPLTKDMTSGPYGLVSARTEDYIALRFLKLVIEAYYKSAKALDAI